MQASAYSCCGNFREARTSKRRTRTPTNWHPATRNVVGWTDPDSAGLETGDDSGTSRKGAQPQKSAFRCCKCVNDAREFPLWTQVFQLSGIDPFLREKRAVHRCVWKTMESRRNLEGI